MKKVGLFLLALILVAGFIGCGGGDDDDDSIVVFINPICVDGTATGTITNTNTGWSSGTLTVSRGVQSSVVLPEKGVYRAYFKDKSGYWDDTGELEDGETITLGC